FTGSAAFVSTDAPFDTTLVVTQQLAPGWRATIDGHDAETFRLGLFRAVRLSRGHHDVAWRYHPASLIVGACITLLAIARLLLSLLFVKGRAHQNFFARHSKLRGLLERCEV